MTLLLPVLLAALLASGVLLLLGGVARARRRRREAAVCAEFERFVEGLPGWTAERAGEGWRLAAHGRSLAPLPLGVVLGAAERARPRGAAARAETWGARLAGLAAPLVPLDGPLGLKVHGPRLLPRPTHPEILASLPPEAAPAVGRWTELDLPLLYLVAETDPPAYVPEQAAREAGLDPAALGGVATAVLRQRLDPTLVERALSGELVEARPADGCGAARLILLPEMLAPGERLAALALDPATLLLAPSAAADRLEARLAEARAGGPREVLLDRVLEVRSDGVERGHR